jgi:hypothetical protein
MTPFSNIYDKALVVIQDYKLDNLANKDYASFLLFMKGLLENGIDLFNGTLSDLSWTDRKEVEHDADGNEIVYDDSYFNADLTSKEQSIIAMLVVYKWFEREMQDVRQFNNHLQTRDFKVYSEANNLKQKSEYADKLREKYLYEIQQYQLNNLDSFWEV